MGKHKTIAFFTYMLSDPLSCSILEGIRDVLSEQNIDLYTFSGGSFKHNTPWVDISANIVFNLVSSKRFDGIIVNGGAIGHYITRDEIDSFCKCFTPIPIINISLKLDNYPSVITSNYEGIYKITDHLIKKHKLRKIGFLKGPEKHDEAIERYQAFIDAMNSNSIEIKDELIVEGDFSKEAGIACIKELFDIRGADIEALVCVDDDSAQGAIEELNRRDIDIPDDIVITGFDDNVCAKHLFPSLTSVNPKSKQLGIHAAKALLDLIEGRNVAKIIKVESIPVFRESCGCKADISNPHGRNVPICIDSEDIDKLVNDLVHKFESRLSIDNTKCWKIVTSLLKSIKNNNSDIFIVQLKKFISKQPNLYNKSQILNTFLNNLESNIADKKNDFLLTLFWNARLLVCESVNKAFALREIVQKTDYFVLNRTNQLLHQTMSLDELFRESYKHFCELNINTAYIAFYNEVSKPEKGLRLVFGLKDGEVIDNRFLGRPFEYTEVLPDGLFNGGSKHKIVISLSFNRESMGYMVLELENLELLHPLCWHYSSTIKRLFILEEEVNRTKELEMAMKKLKQTQKKLVEAEKLASLGNLVAGVAHEINTPLGIGLTYSTFIEDVSENLIEKVSNNNIRKSELERALSSIKTSSNSLTVSLEKASSLIQSFKNVAVESLNFNIKEFYIDDIVHDTVSSIHNRIVKNNINLKLSEIKNIMLTSSPGAIHHCILAFIDNSINHAFSNTDNPEISIDISDSEKNVYITYEDNGSGLNSNERKKIFEPFYTTKRTQGFIGLGLHTVYNIVNSVLKGSIEISEITDGFEAVLEIPKRVD